MSAGKLTCTSFSPSWHRIHALKPARGIGVRAASLDADAHLPKRDILRSTWPARASAAPIAVRLKPEGEPPRCLARLSWFDHVFKNGLKGSEASSIEENRSEQGAETCSVLLQSQPAGLSGRPTPCAASASRRQSLRSRRQTPCCAIGRQHRGRQREVCKYRYDLRTEPRPVGRAGVIRDHRTVPTVFLVLPFHNLLTVAMMPTSPCD